MYSYSHHSLSRDGKLDISVMNASQKHKAKKMAILIFVRAIPTRGCEAALSSLLSELENVTRVAVHSQSQCLILLL